MTIDPGVYEITVRSDQASRPPVIEHVPEHLRTLPRHARVVELLEQRWERIWQVKSLDQRPGLPPDLTCGRWPNQCTARIRADWQCTRIAGHTGRHAAGDGEHVVAVWGDVWPPPRDIWRPVRDDGRPARGGAL